MAAQVEEAALEGGRVQSLKEIKKSRRTVMLGSALALPSHGEEIGRASCRERV